jgi:hypothetical protein
VIFLRLSGFTLKAHGNACYQHHEPAHRPGRRTVFSSGSAEMLPASEDAILAAVSGAAGMLIRPT